MSEWKNEEDIKAELRAMTDELRKLREGLRSPPRSHPPHEFLLRHTRPAPAEPAPPAASDGKRPKKTGRGRKKGR